jgi:hypothetical protein
VKASNNNGGDESGRQKRSESIDSGIIAVLTNGDGQIPSAYVPTDQHLIEMPITRTAATHVDWDIKATNYRCINAIGTSTLIVHGSK